MKNPPKFKKIFLLFLLTLLFQLSISVQAKTTCRNTIQGELCTSEVDFRDFRQRAYQTQKLNQWCWAACISMIFNYYGHPVSQERIVEDAYGGIVNMPAINGITIARRVDRSWTDDDGNEFTSSLTGMYDELDGIRINMDNTVLIEELDNDRPLIIGAGTHAVVQTSFTYYRTWQGIIPVSVGVFDPWPGRGARNLTPAEMLPGFNGGQLHFVASVSVDD